MERYNEKISILKIAELLNVSKEDIVMAMEANSPINSIEEEIYTDNKSENQISIIDRISSKTDEANMVINKVTINKLINNLDNRDRQLIMLRYYREKTQTQVAKILGISQVQVSRIEKKILKNMKKELA